MRNQLWLRSLLLASAALSATGLSGCGVGVSSSASKPVVVTAAALQGVVMGGQQPVAGVTLQLHQAGTTGYSSAATPLGVSVQTNANGNFNFPSYTCAAGSQVYLVGTGGHPTALLTNNNLAMMVGLGTCGGTYLNNFIDMNELTTVATVWALSPFMTGISNVGTSSTNTAGLADAFAAINQVVTVSNGTIPGPTLPAPPCRWQRSIHSPTCWCSALIRAAGPRAMRVTAAIFSARRQTRPALFIRPTRLPRP